LARRRRRRVAVDPGVDVDAGGDGSVSRLRPPLLSEIVSSSRSTLLLKDDVLYSVRLAKLRLVVMVVLCRAPGALVVSLFSILPVYTVLLVPSLV
jgi:hypothetical protein